MIILQYEKWLFPAALVLFLGLYPLVFLIAPIQADDAWLGEQVKSYVEYGKVTSSLFIDCPLMSGDIVVYHKLLIWAGAASCSILGWGLYQLRLVTALCGMLTLVLMLFIPGDDRRVRRMAVILLMFTPLFLNMQMIFRPEMLITVLGFASFATLMHARERQSMLLYAISGALAGLAGLAHGLGLAFAIAAFVLLVFEKKYVPAFVCVLTALLFFSPYLSGLLTDRNLFSAQLTGNDLMLAKLPTHWWQPLANLLEEHKRIFRKAEVIGISVLFILTLLRMNKTEWLRHRPVLVFIGVLVVITGLTPFPKMTQYMVPVTPLLALLIARVWMGAVAPSDSRRRVVSKVFNVWLMIFLLYGASAMAYAAFVKRNPQMETNVILAEQMQPGGLVMAPLDFVFPDNDKFSVLSWHGAGFAAKGEKTPAFLENYAADLGVEYLIADPVRLRDWGLEINDLDSAFKLYRAILKLEDNKRYLFKRIDGAPDQSGSHIVEPMSHEN